MFYSELLIKKYSKLLIKYPRILKIVELRSKFQFYYSLIDFILIFTVASTIIYINVLIYVQ